MLVAGVQQQLSRTRLSKRPYHQSFAQTHRIRTDPFTVDSDIPNGPCHQLHETLELCSDSGKPPTQLHYCCLHLMITRGSGLNSHHAHTCCLPSLLLLLLLLHACQQPLYPLLPVAPVQLHVSHVTVSCRSHFPAISVLQELQCCAEVSTGCCMLMHHQQRSAPVAQGHCISRVHCRCSTHKSQKSVSTELMLRKSFMAEQGGSTASDSRIGVQTQAACSNARLIPTSLPQQQAPAPRLAPLAGGETHHSPSSRLSHCATHCLKCPSLK